MKLLILLVLALLTNAGCQSPVGPAYPRTPREQDWGSVRIEAGCMSAEMDETTGAMMLTVSHQAGTGVVMGPQDILTAYHIIDCPLVTLYVTAPDGTEYPAVPGRLDKDRDLAHLTLTTGTMDNGPPVVGPPVSGGDVVCLSPSVPDRTRHCGVVEQSKDGLIVHTADTQPGNSGSGVYDSRGRLVGIVSKRWMAKPGGIAVALTPEDAKPPA